MTARNASHRRSVPAAPALAAAVVLLAAATLTAGPAAQSAAPTPAAPKRNIAGPGDYALREKIVHAISRDPDLPRESITIILVNGGVVFSGEIKSCALKKRALSLAATTRGVINVTDEMTVPRGEVADAGLAKAVTSLLSDAAASLDLKNLDVRVADGVLTLEGTVKNVLSRSRAEDIAGTVLGVTRISNHLKPADAPSARDDASLLHAELAYLGDFHAYSYPADITVKVDQGVVTLKGKTGLFMGRQQAALVASLVNGAVRVDNRIKVDASVLPRTSRVQAEK
jgi:osmotically-inducible protein OsmY